MGFHSGDQCLQFLDGGPRVWSGVDHIEVTDSRQISFCYLIFELSPSPKQRLALSQGSWHRLLR